jgi:hypothetical protein
MKLYIAFLPLILASRLQDGGNESDKDSKGVDLAHFRSEQASQCETRPGNIPETIILECIGLEVDATTEINLKLVLGTNNNLGNV